MERFPTPLLSDPEQKRAILRSKERRLRTSNIINTCNLFIFPSDFQRWQPPFVVLEAQGAQQASVKSSRTPPTQRYNLKVIE